MPRQIEKARKVKPGDSGTSVWDHFTTMFPKRQNLSSYARNGIFNDLSIYEQIGLTLYRCPLRFTKDKPGQSFLRQCGQARQNAALEPEGPVCE
jgi:hypothetical protein